MASAFQERVVIAFGARDFRVADVGHGFDGGAVFFQAEAAAGEDLLVAAGVEVCETAGEFDLFPIDGDGAEGALAVVLAASGTSS